MPIITPSAPVPKLVMTLFTTTQPLDPAPLIQAPYIIVTMRRDDADSFLVRLKAVDEIRSNRLYNAPPGEPNFVTACIEAAYQHRGSYKGSRSELRFQPFGPDLKLYFQFSHGTTSEVTGNRKYTKRT